ncbi:endodeoxyribonuclease RusA [Clostridium beijerinckii]|nr:endodeoxyribonuclease RusA [Clostridium beijerinckii]
MTYENWVRICYQQQDRRYLEGSIKATIIAYYKIPKSYSKKRLEAIRAGIERPQKKPDIDNVAKVILDSLNKIAYKDDSQITELIVKKVFTEELERVEFELEVIR